MQLTEQVAENAMFRVGCITEETRQAWKVAEAAFAEAKSVQGAVESRVASLSVQAHASATRTVEVMTGRVDEMAAQSDAQTSCVATEVTQHLESKIQAAVISMAAMR